MVQAAAVSVTEAMAHHGEDCSRRSPAEDDGTFDVLHHDDWSFGVPATTDVSGA